MRDEEWGISKDQQRPKEARTYPVNGESAMINHECEIGYKQEVRRHTHSVSGQGFPPMRQRGVPANARVHSALGIK